MARTYLWVALTLVSLWLSGCAGADAKEEPVAPTVASGDTLDGGTLRAIIIDDAALPLQGATVGITQLGLQSTSDETGTALFTNLPPGSYQVAAATLGYSSAAKAVNVEVGVESAVTLTLIPIVIETPFQQTFGPLQGYFDCRMGATTVASTWTAACGTVSVPLVGFVGPGTAGQNPWANDNSVLKFQVATNNTQTVIGDMRWTPSAVGTSTSLRFAFSYDGRPSTHWWCSGEGPSELQWRWEAEAESTCSNVGSSDEEPVPRTHNDDGEPLTMRVYANAPFGTLENPVYLTLQQKFEIITTVFYGERAPDVFSGFTDG